MSERDTQHSSRPSVSRDHWDTLHRAHERLKETWLEMYRDLEAIAAVKPSSDPEQAQAQLKNVVGRAQFSLYGKERPDA